METFYKAYTKMIENKSYYFIKKYLRFPEYKDVADIMEGYGMHTDFNKACNIAGLEDIKIKEELLNGVNGNSPQAKVIELNPASEIIMSKKIVP